MPSWLATTISVMTGGILTMFAAWIADRRLTERERERRREERRERFVIRRNDFQRQTLLHLQVAAQKLLRTTGAMLYQDMLATSKSGEWQKQKFGEDLFDNGLSNDHLLHNTETMLLASRVYDDEVRSLAKDLRDHSAHLSMSANQQVAEDRMASAANVQQALIERIGKLVREMDEAV